MADEIFHEAALRHFYDAELLYTKQRYDNAFCLYGFAAECALKSLAGIAGCSNASDYLHNFINIKQDMNYLDLLCQEDTWLFGSPLQLRLDNLHIPKKLEENHPGHRYFKDNYYSKTDCKEVKPCITAMAAMVAETLLDRGSLEGLFE